MPPRSKRYAYKGITLMVRLIALRGFFILLLCSGATAGPIVNGDFATGDFDGWSLYAEDQSLDEIESKLQVVSVGQGMAASFATGTFSEDYLIQRMEQTFHVTLSEPILEFDVSTPIVSQDSTGSGAGLGIDELYVSVRTSPVDPIESIAVDASGLHVDPIGTAAGLVEIGSPSDPRFDYGVAVDLAGFRNKTVILAVDLIQHDDGFQMEDLLIGNFQVREVPEPHSLTILLVGLLLWHHYRRGAPYD